jgi:hypothetical protein
MRLDHIISQTVSRLVGRLIRRAVAAMLLALFALCTIYQLTAAGTQHLADLYGPVNARLMVAAVYAVAALAAFGFLFATRGKPTVAETELGKPRALRIAMLMESILFGYALARNVPTKRSRTRL